VVAIVRSTWTVRDLIKAKLAKGKPKARVTGGWIDDLASMGKAVVLCELCYRKFSPKQYGYEMQRQICPGHSHVIGDCDGCKRTYQRCKLFLKETR